MTSSRRLRLLPLLALALGPLATCSGSSAGGQVPLDTTPAELGKVFCGKIYACCSVAERMQNIVAGSDQKSCEMIAAGFLALELGLGLRDSVAKGRVVYHPDRMATCLEKMRSLDCPAARMTDLEENSIPECTTAFEPKVAVGGGCAGDDDCVGGFCMDPMASTLGTCVATKADGLACQDDAECTNGACAIGRCAKQTPPADNLCN
jgi:hypothetical protein